MHKVILENTKINLIFTGVSQSVTTNEPTLMNFESYINSDTYIYIFGTVQFLQWL